MTKIFTKTLIIYKILVVILCAGYFSNANAQLNYSDDFSANTSASYTTAGAIGASDWLVTTSGVDFGARRNVATSDQLELSNDISGLPNADGWIFARTASRHHPILSENTSVTWNFNMRQSRVNPEGFAAGEYGAAFVIAGSVGTSATAGTGYAVVLGSTGTIDDRVRLVRYTGGLKGTLTDIITGLNDIGNEYLSIRVVYTASTNTWRLLVRNDGATAFADPTTAGLISQATNVNNTYTGTSRGVMGAFYSAGTAANQNAFFDNF